MAHHPDTHLICKEDIMDRFEPDSSMTVAEHVAVGDTFYLIRISEGCAGPGSLDSIRIIRIAPDRFIGTIIRNVQNRPEERQVSTIQLNKEEFSFFSDFEKQMRLDRGGRSSGPTCYFIISGSHYAHKVDPARASKMYFRFRNDFLIRD